MINVAKEMEHLNKLAGNNQAKRFTDLWESLTSEEWLAQAWEEIRRNRGSRTPGMDKETAEDIDLTRIHHLSRKLHDGLYHSELTPCTVNALQIKAERCKGEVGISIARFLLCAPLWRERCT